MEKNGNKIYFLDTKTNQVTTPFDKPMNSIHFNRRASGTQKIIDKNKLFIDIDTSIFFMDKEEIIWKFNKRVGKNNQALFRWSTYFSNQEIDLDWLNKKKCR